MTAQTHEQLTLRMQHRINSLKEAYEEAHKSTMTLLKAHEDLESYELELGRYLYEKNRDGIDKAQQNIERTKKLLKNQELIDRAWKNEVIKLKAKLDEFGEIAMIVGLDMPIEWSA